MGDGETLRPGFWSGESLKERLKPIIVEGFCEKRIHQATYHLRVGAEIYITPTSEDVDPVYKSKRRLAPFEGAVIPSGQFAILTTEERIKMPDDAIAFISLRSKSAKFRGLVNVSGFHVDPGYKGKLVFTVFNAGPADIHVARCDEWFAIFFAGLDRKSGKIRKEEGYKGIPSDMISPIGGQFLTLKGLDKKIDEERDALIERLHTIEREHTITRWAAVFILGGLLAFGIRQCASPANAQALSASSPHEVVHVR